MHFRYIKIQNGHQNGRQYDKNAIKLLLKPLKSYHNFPLFIKYNRKAFWEFQDGVQDGSPNQRKKMAPTIALLVYCIKKIQL